jgi:ribosomal protein L40E
MSLLFLAALGALVVGFVLHPVFSRGSETPDRLTETDREMQLLEEKKARILAAIKDLDFEHKAGKLSGADFKRIRADEFSQVAQIMARMEELSSAQEAAPAGPEAAPREPRGPERARESAGGTSCPSCQTPNPPNAKFCLHCGSGMAISVQCSRCQAKLPEQASFCSQCGAPVQTQ